MVQECGPQWREACLNCLKSLHRGLLFLEHAVTRNSVAPARHRSEARLAASSSPGRHGPEESASRRQAALDLLDGKAALRRLNPYSSRGEKKSRSWPGKGT